MGSTFRHTWLCKNLQWDPMDKRNDGKEEKSDVESSAGEDKMFRKGSLIPFQSKRIKRKAFLQFVN